ncbi:hypothetical protein MATL_G00085720 [Megalops atlanticus]|uniref:Uncharacterized protein n=1 Tax=Megalops atlanticus TaxID=7932 RepID=A0A9D3TDY3_MEGAT|nr:hypothetical protein MATL_G00085720 [Megalops atlanticus]
MESSITGPKRPGSTTSEMLQQYWLRSKPRNPAGSLFRQDSVGSAQVAFFSHMTEKDMACLRQQIEDEKRRKEDPEEGASCPERSLEEWLARREKRKEALRTGSLMEEEEEEDPSTDLPPHFISIPDLPPSLLPPPPGGWKGVPHTEWG